MKQASLKSLTESLGISHLPPDAQAEILNKVDKRLEAVLLRVLIENLSEEETSALREIIGEGDENVMERVAALTARIPQLAEKIENAVAEEIGKLRAVLSANENILHLKKTP